MLARKKLLPLKSEFPRIKKEGRMYDSPSFGLLVANNSGLENAQCAFIVSKKIDKRSVVRHNIKRKMAEAVSSFLPHLSKNLELVFLAKTRATEMDKENLKKEMEIVLRRARLLQ